MYLMTPQVPLVLAVASYAAFVIALALIVWSQRHPQERRQLLTGVLLFLVGAVTLSADQLVVMNPCAACPGIDSWALWIFLGCWSCP